MRASPTTPSPRPSPAVAEFLQRAAEDDIVCAFGPDFFFGARTGACAGCLFSAALCGYTFHLLREDQREVDFLAGLKRGQRSPDFSSWTLLRGFRTQPMLTTGCVALATTCVMKAVKCYLANQRCCEFFVDDIDFEVLLDMSKTDVGAATLLSSFTQEGAPSRETAGAPQPVASLSSRDAPRTAPVTDDCGAHDAVSTVSSLLQKHSSRPGRGLQAAQLYRPPTYYDGVAVAFLGSVLDCYLPQKPVQSYHHMRGGLW